MSTPTPSCTWTWARTQASSRGKMPRSESTTHLETTKHAVPFKQHFATFNMMSLFSSLFRFAELVSLLVSAELPGSLGSIRHWLLCGLSKFLMPGHNQMCNFKCRCNTQPRLTLSILVCHAAIWGSSEGVLRWSLLSESFQKLLLPQVSHVFKIT